MSEVSSSRTDASSELTTNLKLVSANARGPNSTFQLFVGDADVWLFRVSHNFTESLCVKCLCVCSCAVVVLVVIRENYLQLNNISFNNNKKNEEEWKNGNKKKAKKVRTIGRESVQCKKHTTTMFRKQIPDCELLMKEPVNRVFSEGKTRKERTQMFFPFSSPPPHFSPPPPPSASSSSSLCF